MYQNLQTKLYGVDALIYNDYTAKLKIKALDQSIKQKQKQIDRLQKGDDNKIEDLKSQIQVSSDSIIYFKKDLLTDAEWKMINELRTLIKW